MAVSTRNNIVADGLVGYFDCSNPRSYTSGSLFWRDLAGNYDIILTGSGGMLPTYWVGNRESIPSLGTLAYNGFSHSNSFTSSVWEKTRTGQTSTVTGSAISAPPGLPGSGSKLNETTVNSRHAMRRGIQLAIGEAMTFSFYAKAAERNWVYYENSDWSDAAVFFNLATGQIGTVNNGGTVNGVNMTPFSTSMQDVGDGWYRCAVGVRTAYDSISTTIGIALADNSKVYSGSPTSGIYIYGAHVNYGTELKPYLDQPDIVTSYNNNGYLEYNAPYIQENNDFSMFIWAKGLMNGSSGRLNLFSKYTPFTDTSGSGITLNVSTDGLGQPTNEGILRNINLLNIFNNPRPLTSHGWFQTGIVRTSTQTIYYWNGRRIGVNNKDTATVTSASVKFGAGNGSGASGAWNSNAGLGFSNIQVYNRPLSDEEVMQNYRALQTRYRSVTPTIQFGTRTAY